MRMTNRLKHLSLIMLLVAACFSVQAATRTMHNVVCFVRFADEDSTVFAETPEHYTQIFNDTTAGANSVYSYFKWVSYGQLDWKSLIYPIAGGTRIVSYQDTQKRGYLRPASTANTIGYPATVFGSLQAQTREQQLLQRVCNYLSTVIPADVALDGATAGKVDNVTLVISGNSETKSSAGILWPHRSTPTWVTGIKIGNYSVSSYLIVFDKANGFLFGMPKPLNTGVICHEMTHSLGAYDLYNNSGHEPVGGWDLMSSNYMKPQGMTAYTRFNIGKWIPSIDEITTSGSYSLSPVGGDEPVNVAYKIKPDATRTEYFMVEYRKQAGTFDVGLPGSGLLVYRITPENYGNLSGTSYEMYIFRPGGTTTVEGEVDNATLSAESGRTSVNGTTDANTLFYSDGTKAPFHISEVGSCGETISFKVTFDNTGVENVAGDIAKAFYDKQSQSIVASRDIKRIDCYTTSGQLIPTQGSDLSTLAKGMYIITVTYNDGQHENLKIIK